MTRERWQAGLLILAVFLLGAIGGGALATSIISRRLAAFFDGPPKQATSRLYGAILDQKLHLSREQLARIVEIVDADQPAVAKLRQRIEPELTEIRRARHAKILAELTAEQRPLAEALEQKFEQRRREELTP